MSTPLQRFQAAAHLGEQDVVPVCPFLTGHYVSWFAGVDESKAAVYWGRDYKTKLRCQLHAVEKFKDAKIWPGVWADFGLAVETSALGCEVVFPENAAPGVKESPVKKPEDIEKLEVPDPKKDGFMPLALEAIEYMKRNLPAGVKNTHGYLDGFAMSLGPTDLVGLVIGYDRYIVWQVNYPDLIHKAMSIATETAISYIEAQLEITGEPNFVIVADDATGFLNRASFERFSFPYVQEILKKFYRRDNMVLFHSDSDNMAIVDKIKEWPFHIYNYGPRMDTEVLKQKLGGKIALIGGLAPLGPLRYGKAGEVDRACKQAIQKGAKGGGFILSTCGGTAAGTPEQNIRTMLKAGSKYAKAGLRA
jgi:uroporphyrinogen decarboxylase